MDQFGNPMATPLNDVAWSIYSGVGTISSSGLYSAPIGGTGVTTVRAVTSTGQILYANAELASTSIFTSNLDIGSPSPTGSGSYTSGSDTYTVAGGGTDIWGNSDQFHFLSQSFTGNGTIIARVESVQNTNVSAKGGVMFRDSTAANAAYAFVWVTPSGNVVFETRSANGTSSGYSSTVSDVGIPVWVRLVRSGNQFSASYSLNGTSWTQVGTTQSVTMATNAQAGLAVTSHTNGTLCTSVFSNVSVTSPDTTSPTVTIDQETSQADPANVSPINFTVVFSEPVTDFATGDVTLSGTAGATTATVTGSGTTYNVAVSGMTANGTVIASLLAGVAHDAANNPSLASTSTDNTVTFSSLLPIADIGDTYTVSVGSSVTLDASNSDDPDGWIVSYLWDLDNDGQYDDASGVTANFSRTDVGSYTVGVKVIDNFGGEDTDTATVTVTDVIELPGDYNQDGTVDAADYTVWRDALTAGATALSNDPTPGTVDESDFLYWRAHFGETLGSGAGQAVSSTVSQAVTVEPASPQPDALPAPEPLPNALEAVAPTVTLQSSNVIAEVSASPSQPFVALLGPSPRSVSVRSTGASVHVRRPVSNNDGVAESIRARALLAFLVDRPGRDHFMDAHEVEDWTDVREHNGDVNDERLSQAESVDAFFGRSFGSKLRHKI